MNLKNTPNGIIEPVVKRIQSEAISVVLSASIIYVLFGQLQEARQEVSRTIEKIGQMQQEVAMMRNEIYNNNKILEKCLQQQNN